MIAKNVSEFLNHIKEITYDNGQVSWYRGHFDERWELKPSVWRDFDRKEEREMNHEFLWKAKSRTNNPPNEKDWSAWLSMMQHYGLPTRLLDWSKSPLIALYFAINKYYRTKITQTHASVWVLFPGQLNQVSNSESFIYSIYTEIARKMIEPAFVNPKYTVENESIIAVSAVETDMRMLTQQSAFTIHSSQLGLEKYTENEKYLKKIIIPSEFIDEMAFELELLGYRPSQVFPDLEHLSLEIKHRYLGLISP